MGTLRGLSSAFLALVFSQLTMAAIEPDWSRHVEIKPGTNRENIYNLSEDEFNEITQEGYKHALVYPVNVSGLFIPYEPMVNFFKEKDNSLMKMILAKIGERTTGIDSVEGLYQWLGLNQYNDEDAVGIYRIPYPEGYKPDYYMGASIVDTKWGKGLTFSCATCHSANLFGTSVMGLTNKTVKANRLFEMAKQFMPFVPPKTFQKITGATDQEVGMLKRTKRNLGAVGVVRPQVLGLDTSLPQVALSLARRKKDPYATKSKLTEAFPRRNILSHEVADSKPAVWWNLKYKTRWLSDGSIVAGNPIFTNFLWNELGRGTDLKELEQWMKDNQKAIHELTAAAFSTKAPLWTDFFPMDSIDVASAKRGESVFKNRCQKCHGTYTKGWSEPNASELSKAELIKTVNVKYHKKTPVKDVGTDPGRYLGTKAFAGALNELQISKWMKTVVEPQKGYVPPPLVGIWSRYPYMHNNAIPTLCDLMKHPSKRTKTFYQIPAESKTEDFDSECVGFPVGNKVPKKRRIKEAFFNTAKKGLRNTGHYRRIFTDKAGNEILTPANKKDLIMFLKTL
jgi:mono/diheme cytochrome c family protein